jgi:hypothetical protein
MWNIAAILSSTKTRCLADAGSKTHIARFDVLTEVWLKIHIFWDGTHVTGKQNLMHESFVVPSKLWKLLNKLQTITFQMTCFFKIHFLNFYMERD